MKYLRILSALLFLISTISYSQLGFGIKGGIDFASLAGGGTPSNAKSLTTFSAGAYLEIPIPSFFILQPEVFFARKGFVQQYGVDLSRIPQIPIGYKATMTLSYLEIPVLLKYTFDVPIVQPSVYAGPGVAILLSANQNINYSNNDNLNIALTGSMAPLDPELLFGASVRVAIVRIDARYSRGFVSVIRAGGGGFNSVWSVMAEVPLY